MEQTTKPTYLWRRPRPSSLVHLPNIEDPKVRKKRHIESFGGSTPEHSTVVDGIFYDCHRLSVAQPLQTRLGQTQLLWHLSHQLEVTLHRCGGVDGGGSGNGCFADRW